MKEQDERLQQELTSIFKLLTGEVLQSASIQVEDIGVRS